VHSRSECTTPLRAKRRRARNVASYSGQIWVRRGKYTEWRKAAERPYRNKRATGRWILPLPFRSHRQRAKSLRPIAAGLEERGIPAARGGKWSAVQVARLLEAVGSRFDGAKVGAHPKAIYIQKQQFSRSPSWL
jgi:hypothetical protein